KAEQDSIANSWVARARNALDGNVDRNPIEGDTVVYTPVDTAGAAAPGDTVRSDSLARDSIPGAAVGADSLRATPDSTRGRVPPDTSGATKRPERGDVPSEVRE